MLSLAARKQMYFSLLSEHQTPAAGVWLAGSQLAVHLACRTGKFQFAVTNLVRHKHRGSFTCSTTSAGPVAAGRASYHCVAAYSVFSLEEIS